MVDALKKLTTIEEATWPRKDLVARHMRELGDILPELRALVTFHETGQALDGAQLAWLTTALYNLTRILQLDKRELTAEQALNIFAEQELMSYYPPDAVEQAIQQWHDEQIMVARTHVSYIDGSRLYALTSPSAQMTRDYINIERGDLLPNRNRALPRMYELRGGKPPNRL